MLRSRDTTWPLAPTTATRSALCPAASSRPLCPETATNAACRCSSEPFLSKTRAELFVARELGGLVGQIDPAQQIERRPGRLRAFDPLLAPRRAQRPTSDVRTDRSTAIVVRSTTTAAASGMRARYIREPLPGDRTDTLPARLSHRRYYAVKRESRRSSSGVVRIFLTSYPQGGCGAFPPLSYVYARSELTHGRNCGKRNPRKPGHALPSATVNEISSHRRRAACGQVITCAFASRNVAQTSPRAEARRRCSAPAPTPARAARLRPADRAARSPCASVTNSVRFLST